MQKCIWRVLVATLLTAVWAVVGSCWASDPSQTDQPKPARAKAEQPADRFELKDGDRVVFIGNTFFEREGRYGYIETMLTTRYPGKRITFRNLGWSGDTVWGESRGYFEPEKGYQNFINLVRELKPTVIILAYGNNEAFAGKEALEPFIKQYNKLLDDLERFTSRIVILGPHWHEFIGEPFPDVKETNRAIALYQKAIHALSSERGYLHAAVHASWSNKPPQTDRNVRTTYNGIHMAEYGYLVNACTLDSRFGMSACLSSTTFTVDDQRVSSDAGNITDVNYLNDGVSFNFLRHQLPLKEAYFGTSSVFVDHLHFEGGNAQYQLRLDGKQLATKTAKEWLDGVELAGVPEFDQVERLRQTIIAKNQLFFHRWRPQNTTYLLGFRKHEQGQNAKEISQFDPLIAAKEEEIFKLAQPVPHKYELIRVEDGLPDGKKQSEAKNGAAKEGGK